MVSISSSSDPSYRIMGMGRGELWQLPNVLQGDEMHVNNITVGDIVWQQDYGVRSVKGQRVGRLSLFSRPSLRFFPQQDDNSFASIQLSVRTMSQCFDPLKLNLFCLFDCAEN